MYGMFGIRSRKHTPALPELVMPTMITKTKVLPFADGGKVFYKVYNEAFFSHRIGRSVWADDPIDIFDNKIDADLLANKLNSEREEDKTDE